MEEPNARASVFHTTHIGNRQAAAANENDTPEEPDSADAAEGILQQESDDDDRYMNDDNCGGGTFTEMMCDVNGGDDDYAHMIERMENYFEHNNL